MKILIVLVSLTALLLSSCTPKAGAPGTNTPLPAATAASLPTESPMATVTAEPDLATDSTTLPTIAFTAGAPATCQLSPVIPSIDTFAEFNVPSSSETDRAYGAATPKITILSYCNFQNPACKSLVFNLADLQQQYQEEVRVVLRQYPQPDVYDKSLLAAYAVEAAGLENRYWQMHNLLYSRQSEWTSLTPINFAEWLVEQAGTLDISRAQWEANVASEVVRSRVTQTIDEAAGLQISATPILFFNNVMVKTGIDPDSLTVLVDYFLLPEKAYNECPPFEIDTTKSYTARFTTEKGDIVFELFDDAAPQSVNSFISLARDGWYDGSTFFRVIPGFVAQGGDPSNSGLGTPGYGITSEADPSLRFDTPGLLVLNRNTDGLSGSQFFITYTELPEMDGQFTIIGRVVEGMSVVNSLRPRDPESDEILLPADILISVIIEEN